MSELNITSGGGLRLGPGTAIKEEKMRAIVSLADKQDYIGTTSALAEQFGYSSTATISSAISILRALGYEIKNAGRVKGYIVTKRPEEFPGGFEHFRKNGQLRIDGIDDDLALKKLPAPQLPKVREFGGNIVLSCAAWVDYTTVVSKIYNDYSVLVDLFNGN